MYDRYIFFFHCVQNNLWKRQIVFFFFFYSNCVWPLSLLALRKVIGMLEINRNPDNKAKFVCAASSLNYDSIENCTDDKLNLIKFKDKYEKLFRKHIKEKKRHEIDKFAKVCMQNNICMDISNV